VCVLCVQCGVYAPAGVKTCQYRLSHIARATGIWWRWVVPLAPVCLVEASCRFWCSRQDPGESSWSSVTSEWWRRLGGSLVAPSDCGGRVSPGHRDRDRGRGRSVPVLWLHLPLVQQISTTDLRGISRSCAHLQRHTRPHRDASNRPPTPSSVYRALQPTCSAHGRPKPQAASRVLAHLEQLLLQRLHRICVHTALPQQRPTASPIAASFAPVLLCAFPSLLLTAHAAPPHHRLPRRAL
jgi:hypothetical protein